LVYSVMIKKGFTFLALENSKVKNYTSPGSCLLQSKVNFAMSYL